MCTQEGVRCCPWLCVQPDVEALLDPSRLGNHPKITACAPAREYRQHDAIYNLGSCRVGCAALRIKCLCVGASCCRVSFYSVVTSHLVSAPPRISLSSLASLLSFSSFRLYSVLSNLRLFRAPPFFLFSQSRRHFLCFSAPSFPGGIPVYSSPATPLVTALGH